MDINKFDLNELEQGSNIADLKHLNQNVVLAKWRREDSVDPNKDNFIKETSVSQRAFLNNRLESMGGHKNCGRNDAFTQFDLVDELKRNSDFDNKSRMALWYLIKNHSRWSDKKTFNTVWRPEQEEYLRTVLLFLDDYKVSVGTGRVEKWIIDGKEITKDSIAEELFEEENILGNKTYKAIYSKILQRKQWNKYSV